MASRPEKMIRSLLLHEVRIAGSFFPAGTGAPTGLRGKGITSVTRTGAGAFLITLDDAWAKLIAVVGLVRLSAAADMAVQFGDYTPATATAKATLVIRTVVGATPTDIAANANNQVCFDLIFSNSIYD